MPTYRIRGNRRVVEQVEAVITAADLAAAAVAFVAACEAPSEATPVSVLSHTVVAGTAKAAKQVRTVEDNIP